MEAEKPVFGFREMATHTMCVSYRAGRGGPGRWIGAQEFCQSGEVDVFTDNAKNETSATLAF